MFENLRLVILDYPKLHIDTEETKKIFSDIIQAKQINFSRADADYVPMSGLDMIGTHYLVYDTSQLYKPKLIMAIRTNAEERGLKHKIAMPYESYISSLNDNEKKRFLEFRKKKKNLIDCNALFVDRKYSFSRTGIPLMDIGYLMIVSELLKKGSDHFMGIGNYRYKTHKWVEPIGYFEDDMIFEHPIVKAPHMLILIQEFKMRWFLEAYEKYKNLYSNRVELRVSEEISGEKLIPDEDLLHKVKNQLNKPKRGLVEVDFVPGKSVAS